MFVSQALLLIWSRRYGAFWLTPLTLPSSLAGRWRKRAGARKPRLSKQRYFRAFFLTAFLTAFFAAFLTVFFFLAANRLHLLLVVRSVTRARLTFKEESRGSTEPRLLLVTKRKRSSCYYFFFFAAGFFFPAVFFAAFFFAAIIITSFAFFTTQLVASLQPTGLRRGASMTKSPRRWRLCEMGRALASCWLPLWLQPRVASPYKLF